jgi:hypothetical protein
MKHCVPFASAAMCVHAPKALAARRRLCVRHICKEIAMPTGASPKREREYKEIKAKLKKEHRYPGREEEVAARIVNKQRAEHGETKQSADKRKH